MYQVPMEDNTFSPQTQPTKQRKHAGGFIVIANALLSTVDIKVEDLKIGQY